MNTRKLPQELAEDLLDRSICSVQVAAVIADSHGITGWGWNSVGSGFGLHAELHALSRSNPSRLKGATIYVAAKRRKSGNPVVAKPCPDCARHLRGIHVYWRDKSGVWR